MKNYMEICKQNGESMKKNIENGMFSIWDKKRIKEAFNFGNGSMRDFNRYMRDNRQYAYFKEV